MKTLNLNLPFRKKPDEDKALPKQHMVAEFVLRGLVNKRYEKGMNRTDSRLWGRIMDMLDDTTDGKIRVEQSELFWIRDVLNHCLDNSLVPPPWSGWVILVDDYIERMVKEANEELKQPKLEEPTLKSVPRDDG